MFTEFNPDPHKLPKNNIGDAIELAIRTSTTIGFILNKIELVVNNTSSTELVYDYYKKELKAYNQ